MIGTSIQSGEYVFGHFHCETVSNPLRNMKRSE